MPHILTMNNYIYVSKHPTVTMNLCIAAAMVTSRECLMWYNTNAIWLKKKRKNRKRGKYKERGEIVVFKSHFSRSKVRLSHSQVHIIRNSCCT